VARRGVLNLSGKAMWRENSTTSGSVHLEHVGTYRHSERCSAKCRSTFEFFCRLILLLLPA
jgi:hypothetical protein